MASSQARQRADSSPKSAPVISLRLSAAARFTASSRSSSAAVSASKESRVAYCPSAIASSTRTAADSSSRISFFQSWSAIAGLWIRCRPRAAAIRICSTGLSSCRAISAASSGWPWRARAWIAVALTTGSLFSSM